MFAALLCMIIWSSNAFAAPGGVFVTGHDPDFHAFQGGNQPGAQHIIQRGVAYVTHDKPQPRLLLITDRVDPGGGYSDPSAGVVAAGFSTFDMADCGSGTSGTLDLNSVDFAAYDALVVASDFGGWLRQCELDILIARKSELVAYINGGGGLVAFAESGNSSFGLTMHDQFGFLPFLATSAALNQTEIGNTVTAEGAALGLTDADVNGNASHNIFTATGGMDVIDVDATSEILSLATRKAIGNVGVLNPTSTTVECSPGTVSAGRPITCTAMVSDTAGSGHTTPTGAVSFTSSGPGSFGSGGTCALSETSTGVASCQLTYTPGPGGSSTDRSDTITADYGGDPTHDTSNGSTSVTVSSSPPPGDCSNVAPNVTLLWPPNHTFRLITLSDRNSTVTVTVSGVTQDEPLNGSGDGNTSPDAKWGSVPNQVWLRAERSGGGDGRVYRISFNGSGGLDATCSGTVLVGVPHDQGPKGSPKDSGGTYNSFAP
jgi:hypothetical protein